MKEFITQTGGRYVYADDLLNLQDLALSISSLFSGADNFVISGCKPTNKGADVYDISSGYVYIDGKIRLFSGASDTTISNGYYLVATHSVESVKYAQDATKAGRNIYGVIGQLNTPSADAKYIKIESNGTYPTLNSSFFGKYGLLLNPTTSQQTVGGNVIFSNNISAASVESKTSIVKDAGNRSKKESFKSGQYDIEFLNGVSSKATFSILDNGNISFSVLGEKIMEISPSGVWSKSQSSNSESTLSPDIKVIGNQIFRSSGLSDSDSIKINFFGYNGGTSKFRNFEIFDGKNGIIAKFNGADKSTTLYGNTIVDSSGKIVLSNLSASIGDSVYSKVLEWRDKTSDSAAAIGFVPSSTIFKIQNGKGNIELGASVVNITGAITRAGVNLDNIYGAKSIVDGLVSGKVDKVNGKGLSQEDFTTTLKNKLNGIDTGSLESGNGGYITGGVAFDALALKLSKSSNLSDLTDKSASRTNLDVHSKSESDAKYAAKASNLSDLSNKDAARATLNAEKIGNCYTKVETYNKSEVFSKNESTNGFEAKMERTDWIACTKGENVRGNFSVKAKKIGNMVCIQGIISCNAPTDSTWFSLPPDIPSPVNGIGGVHFVNMSNTNYQRGLNWKCDPNSRDFKVLNSYGSDQETGLNITYMI